MASGRNWRGILGLSGACYANRESGRKANVTRIAASTDNYQQPIVIFLGVGVAWINGRKCKNQRQRARQPNKWRANGRAETPGPRRWVSEGTATKAGFTPRADGARGVAITTERHQRRREGPPQSRPPNIRQWPATAWVGYRPQRRGQIAMIGSRIGIGEGNRRRLQAIGPKAQGRTPWWRMPRQGRRSRRHPAPGGWQAMPQGLESEDISEGRR